MPEYIRWLVPFLSLTEIIILLSIMLMLCLVLGRFTLKMCRIDRYLSSNFVVNLPIYGAAGFLFTTLVLNIIGIFFIGTTSLVIFLIITASSVFILLYFGDLTLIIRKAQIIFRRTKRLNFSLRSLSSYLVPLILIVLTLYHFSRAIEIMGWPPLSDITTFHGPLTSLLVYNGKITPTLEPLSSRQLPYPMGFHTVAANFASWFDLFSGEAVFLLGGLIIILIPLLIYSITYMYTRSIPFSLLTYFATFIIHPYPTNWGRWLMGYFYGGPYPNLAGLLLVIFSIVILSLEYLQPEKIKKQELYVGSIVILILSLFGLLLIYPPFTIFVAIMIIFILSKHFRDVLIFIRKKPILIIPPLSYGLLFMFIPNFYDAYSSEIFTSIMVKVYGITMYTVSPTFFYDHITGYVMCIALGISMIFLFKKKYLYLSLFYIIIFCIIIFTLSPMVPSILYLILPARAVMIPWIMSWFVLTLGFTEIIRIGRLKKYFNSYVNISIILAVSIIILISLPQFTSSMVQEFSYANAQRWGWYTRVEYFPDNYAALLWINYNIPPEDLILIDRSWSSMWILSFSVKNVTYFYIPMDSYEKKRLVELEAIWNEPYDNETVYQLLEKYNVSYIFVTSDWDYFVPSEIGGGPFEWRVKPFNSSEYVSIFDTYPFLEIAFRSGFTTVYKVDITSGSG